MTDYIKREDAIKAFDPLQRRDWYTPWIVETLKDLPSVDVAPVRHGRWERELGAYFGSYPRFVYHCSICGHAEEHAYADSKCSNYCPNCGTKMDGESDE